jgi:Flp pilus assembly protein TadD
MPDTPLRAPANDAASATRDAEGSFVASALRGLAWPILIVVVTMWAFWPVTANEFVHWDDDAYLLNNQRYRGFGAAELRWMFTTFYMGHYAPLSWLSYAADHLAWGMNPLGYHLSNLLLHIAGALAFYGVASHLLRQAQPWSESDNRLGAGIAALFFAVHPLRVESVAWASERRDVLSGVFFLLSVLLYLCGHADRESSGRVRCGHCWLAGSLALYAASLLSKAAGVALPIVLLLLDWYPLCRWRRVADLLPGQPAARVALEKLPYAILASVASVLAVWAQSHSGFVVPIASLAISDRLLNAAYAIWFYFCKTLLPLGLSPLVPLPVPLEALSFRYLGSAAAALGATACLLVARRRWPAALVAAGYYVVMLLPVSGLIQLGGQSVADRYSYLSCLGFALLLGAGVVAVRRTASRLSAAAAPGVAACLVVSVLGLLTRHQARVWQNTVTLWACVLRQYPDSAIARMAYADYLVQRGRADEAIPHLDRAIESSPSLAEARYRLGTALFALRRFAEASQSFQDAVRLKPDHLWAWTHLGLIAMQQGNLEQAVSAFQQAVAAAPHNGAALNNLATALARLGRRDEAIGYWRRAAESSPDSPHILENLAWHLACSPEDGLRDGAQAALLAERACRQTRGRSATGLDALAAAYAEMGRYEDAARAARQAIDAARRSHDDHLAQEIENRLALYEANRPYRMPVTAHQ